MRKFLILIFCILFAACAGNRTLDGETNKNWIKIVSSKIDRSGNIQDVCFLLDLSFYPGTVYDRLKNNPSTCLEECCWYSENKQVEFYFNDGFIRELEETGASRRYYPDHISIKMVYSPFINRLSAKAGSNEGITKDGVVMLEYDDVYKTEQFNNESLYRVEAKIFPEDPSSKKQSNTTSYKTFSMSGLNRDELLAKAKAERDSYYSKAVEERYISPEKEYVEESMLFTGQVSPFDKMDKETKWLSKKTLAEEEEFRLNRYRQNRYTKEEKERALRAKGKKFNDIDSEMDEYDESYDEEYDEGYDYDDRYNDEGYYDDKYNEDRYNDEYNTEIRESEEVIESENIPDRAKNISIVRKKTSNIGDDVYETEYYETEYSVPDVEGDKQVVKKYEVKKQKNSKEVKSLNNDNSKFDDMVMYDVQRPLAQEAKIVYIEPKMPEYVDSKTLNKMLAYERTEAVKLLKRFYGDEIDAYLHALDKYKRLEGKILFTGDKIWQAKKIATTVYEVNCNVKGSLAVLSNDSRTITENYPIYCGSYIVNLDEKTVEARDDMARRIAQEEY
ncbi:MAG: hypothetical protein J5594_00310 [Elusimicrobiaceae bacterium]|nr:hypothetical protein [Elusimicrobiaceae bacterium]